MIKQKKMRSALLFFVFSLVFLVIIGNLFYIQILRRSFFVGLGKQQYDATVVVQPPRALIYDCANKPIAVNAECLSAFILPRQLDNSERTLAFIKRYFPQAFERWHGSKNNYFMYIKRHLDLHELALIKAHNIDDIKLLKEPCRYYPAETLGTIVGITDIDNHGLFGVEQLYNEQLAGHPSVCRLERDARSGHFYFNKITDVQGTQGTPVKLTIDSTLQFLAYQELKDFVDKFHAKEGGVVIVDPVTGAVLTSTSWPDFNPNDTHTVMQEYTKNYPFTQCYEFGSIIKVFCAVAALEEGVATLDEPIDCENKETTYVAGMQVNTVKANGIIPFSEVIEKSNNIGTVKVAMRVGPKLYDYYIRFGFGQKTPINFNGEQKGFVNPPDRWTKRSIFSLSYGYEISATLMQLAQAFGLIAQHGVPISLHMIADRQVPVARRAIFNQNIMDQMREVLARTVQQGTAQHARIKGYQVMGKTGTANLVENGRYNPHKNLFTFSGIIEKDSYKRVIVVYLKEIENKHDFHAAEVAVPLFERVAEKMLIHDKII